MLVGKWLRRSAAPLVVLGAVVAPAPAFAATLVVDDDRADCPSAGHTSVQAAVDDASTGDTVVVCPGVYEEGPTTVPATGANAVTIQKAITIKGAGADKVTIRPKPSIASLLGTTTSYRNGTGAVIGVARNGVRQLVDISGVTVEGGSTVVGAGVKFWNAEGSFTASRVRAVAPLTGPQGYGVVIASNLAADRFPVRVSGDAISGYAKAGVVVDNVTQQAPMLNTIAATVSGNTITGAGPQAVTAQQGVLVTGFLTGAISGNVITANKLDDGDAATTADTVSSAGVRVVDLDLTPSATGGTTTKLTATANTIAGNGDGLRNETAAGADRTPYFTATGNWWGSVNGPSLTLPATAGDPVNGTAPGPIAGSTTAVNYSGFRTTAITAPVVPAATPDAPPTGAIESPSADGTVVAGRSYTLAATAADDFGVKSVGFAAGPDAFGIDSTAPYAAPTAWTPGAAQIGTDVPLTLTVVDSSNQVATVTRSVRVIAEPPAATPPATGTGEPPPVTSPPAATPPPAAAPPATATPSAATPPAAAPSSAPPAALRRFLPVAVRTYVTPGHGGRLLLSGRVTRPKGIACPKGTKVRVSVYVGGKLSFRQTATVSSVTCSWSLAVRAATRVIGHRATVRVSYLGGGRLLARSAPSRTVTVRR